MSTLYGFASRFNKALENKGITKKQLAHEIGCGRKAPFTWAAGDNLPNSLYLARMCKTLGVSADWMLFGKEK